MLILRAFLHTTRRLDLDAARGGGQEVGRRRRRGSGRIKFHGL